MSLAQLTLAELAEHIGAKLKGDGERMITGIAPLQTATSSEVTFLHNSRYRPYLSSSKAAAIIISPSDSQDCQIDTLVVSNPYLAFAKSVELFAYQPENPIGIHPTAVIGENCRID